MARRHPESNGVVPLPVPLFMDLYCNDAVARMGVGCGCRVFEFVACNGLHIRVKDTLGEEHVLPRSGVTLSRVHGCKHRVSSDGFLEVRPRPKVKTDRVSEWMPLCPWDFGDDSIPLVTAEERINLRFRKTKKRSVVEEDDDVFDLED